MGTYKTPGVYIEEISTLPASVARVETAIPVFIGLTQKAKDNGGRDLTDIPTRISSLVEYTSYYGGASSFSVNSVVLGDSGEVLGSDSVIDSYTYESVRLFYSNGGGDCYIVSLGDYDTTPALQDFEDALAAISKVDEPTLLVAPDVQLLDQDSVISYQQSALAQCATLQDRFAVLDIPESGDFDADIEAFRDEIGINNLKYGAAYTPWLYSNYDRRLLYTDIVSAISLETGGALDWSAYTDLDISGLIDNLDDSVLDYNEVRTDLDGLLAGTMEEDYSALADSVSSAVTTATTTLNPANVAAAQAALLTLIDYVYDLVELVDDWTSLATTGTLTTDEEVARYIDQEIGGADSNLFVLDALVATGTAPTNPIGASLSVTYGGADWNGTFTGVANSSVLRYPTAAADSAQEVENIRFAMAIVRRAFEDTKAAINYAFGLTEEALRGIQATMMQVVPPFKAVFEHLDKELALTPPAGAVVGAYAYVDSTRGVWKAPANISLAGIEGLTQNISHEEQEGLNVDTTAGKSINALRFFHGKGHLIWGARTLAGNDNEWRYVPVRRLFIMAEESIKKATEFVVFEPNDANTWIKVKGMIEAFLTGLWRDGALAGAKPNEAFYVNVGLGKTMTSQDILEGRLIVEIGMAAVRPAEFIILRFMHKLQES